MQQPEILWLLLFASFIHASLATTSCRPRPIPITQTHFVSTFNTVHETVTTWATDVRFHSGLRERRQLIVPVIEHDEYGQPTLDTTFTFGDGAPTTQQHISFDEGVDAFTWVDDEAGTTYTTSYSAQRKRQVVDTNLPYCDETTSMDDSFGTVTVGATTLTITTCLTTTSFMDDAESTSAPVPSPAPVASPIQATAPPVLSCVPTPTPHQSGIAKDCNKYYFLQRGEGCDTVAKKLRITEADIIKLNAEAGSDCTGLRPDNWICIGAGSCSATSTYAPVLQVPASPVGLTSQPTSVSSSKSTRVLESQKTSAQSASIAPGSVPPAASQMSANPPAVINPGGSTAQQTAISSTNASPICEVQDQSTIPPSIGSAAALTATSAISSNTPATPPGMSVGTQSTSKSIGSIRAPWRTSTISSLAAPIPAGVSGVESVSTAGLAQPPSPVPVTGADGVVTMSTPILGSFPTPVLVTAADGSVVLSTPSGDLSLGAPLPPAPVTGIDGIVTLSTPRNTIAATNSISLPSANSAPSLSIGAIPLPVISDTPEAGPPPSSMGTSVVPPPGFSSSQGVILPSLSRISTTSFPLPVISALSSSSGAIPVPVVSDPTGANVPLPSLTSPTIVPPPGISSSPVPGIPTSTGIGIPSGSQSGSTVIPPIGVSTGTSTTPIPSITSDSRSLTIPSVPSGSASVGSIITLPSGNGSGSAGTVSTAAGSGSSGSGLTPPGSGSSESGSSSGSSSGSGSSGSGSPSGASSSSSSSSSTTVPDPDPTDIIWPPVEWPTEEDNRKEKPCLPCPPSIWRLLCRAGLAVLKIPECKKVDINIEWPRIGWDFGFGIDFAFPFPWPPPPLIIPDPFHPPGAGKGNGPKPPKPKPPPGPPPGGDEDEDNDDDNNDDDDINDDDDSGGGGGGGGGGENPTNPPNPPPPPPPPGNNPTNGGASGGTNQPTSPSPSRPDCTDKTAAITTVGCYINDTSTTCRPYGTQTYTGCYAFDTVTTNFCDVKTVTHQVIFCGNGTEGGPCTTTSAVSQIPYSGCGVVPQTLTYFPETTTFSNSSTPAGSSSTTSSSSSSSSSSTSSCSTRTGTITTQSCRTDATTQFCSQIGTSLTSGCSAVNSITTTYGKPQTATKTFKSCFTNATVTTCPSTWYETATGCVATGTVSSLFCSPSTVTAATVWCTSSASGSCRGTSTVSTSLVSGCDVTPTTATSYAPACPAQITASPDDDQGQAGEEPIDEYLPPIKDDGSANLPECTRDSAIQMRYNAVDYDYLFTKFCWNLGTGFAVQESDGDLRWMWTVQYVYENITGQTPKVVELVYATDSYKAGDAPPQGNQTFCVEAFTFLVEECARITTLTGSTAGGCYRKPEVGRGVCVKLYEVVGGVAPPPLGDSTQTAPLPAPAPASSANLPEANTRTITVTPSESAPSTKASSTLKTQQTSSIPTPQAGKIPPLSGSSFQLYDFRFCYTKGLSERECIREYILFGVDSNEDPKKLRDCSYLQQNHKQAYKERLEDGVDEDLTYPIPKGQNQDCDDADGYWDEHPSTDTLRFPMWCQGSPKITSLTPEMEDCVLWSRMTDLLYAPGANVYPEDGVYLQCRKGMVCCTPSAKTQEILINCAQGAPVKDYVPIAPETYEWLYLSVLRCDKSLCGKDVLHDPQGLNPDPKPADQSDDQSVDNDDGDHVPTEDELSSAFATMILSMKV